MFNGIIADVDTGIFGFGNKNSGAAFWIDSLNTTHLQMLTFGGLHDVLTADTTTFPGFFFLQIGDIGSNNNGTNWVLDDAHKFIHFQVNTDEDVALDGVNQYSYIGNTGGNSTNHKLGIKFDSANLKATIGTFDNLEQYFQVDSNLKIIKAGDLLGIGNNTLFKVDDIAKTISAIAQLGFKTSDPGSGSGAWKLGKIQTGVSLNVDHTHYVEVMIDGVIKKLALVL